MNNFSGLNDFEVKKRMNEGKVNKDNYVGKSYLEIFSYHIFTFFNFINLILFIMIVFVKEYKNGLFIFTVLINLVIGIFQEIKAKNILDKLKIINKENVYVIRNNEKTLIKSDEIVVDDIILLNNNSQVMVDVEIISGCIYVNESLLTGESDVVLKKDNEIVYSGSIIVNNDAIGRVVNVGKNSFSNKLIIEAKLHKENESVLRKTIDNILKIISVVIIPIGFMLFYNLYYVNNISFNNSIVKVVAALVGMIPEGLVFLISISLSVAAIRLSKINVLIQKLFSVENLARVDTVCFDKTGTITSGVMNVKALIKYSDTDIFELIGNFNRVFKSGNQTFDALKKYFGESQTLSELYTKPFSSDLKYCMINFDKSEYYLGAYQNICFEQNIIDDINKYAKEGYRVLCLSKKEETFKTLAIIIIEDVLRKNSNEIINYLNNNDVRVKIISGDDPITVSNICRLAGINGYEKYVDVSKLDDSKLINLLEETVIFARVKPHQKKLIIKGLQEKNHHVAMCGDGINDILALKQADVGISMFTASDGAKNIADLILMNDDFSSIIQIINEGRRVINNINKASSMFFIKTTLSVLLAVIVIFFKFEYPFLPIHFTIISMFNVGIPTALLQLENDFRIVKNNFFENLIVNSILTGIIIVFGILLFNYFGFNKNISVYYTSILYSFSLIRIYGFSSKYKKVVISFCIVLFFITLVLFKSFIGITALNFLEIKQLFLSSFIAILGNILIIKLVKKSLKISNL
ncbi:MAG: HAD-IC family P-type ATPase [Erysipelotrichaceae bacterium]|nr:HAD-IC family P-type ATPase [Erysipelotrichaceae bacterium]